MWSLARGQIVGRGALDAPSSGVTFTEVTFDGANDYLTRGAQFTGLTDGEEFTFVIRFRPVDAAANRTIFRDAADNFFIRLNAASQVQGYMYSGATPRILFQTTAVVLNAGGMVTLFLAGRTTSGSEVFQVYNDSTDITPVGYTHNSGAMDMTSTDWGMMANVAGTEKLAAGVEFLWFDQVYYDVSDSAVRAKWTSGQINANGSGPGAQPILFVVGAASVWNAGTNAGTGGGLVMTGAVT